MAEPSKTETRRAMQIAAVIVTAAAVINVAFYFLSSLYFEDRAAMYGVTSAAAINAVRIAFASFSGFVALAAIGAAFAPRVIGHGLAAAAGLLALFASVMAYRAELHVVLSAALLVVGLLVFPLVRASLARSRPAWSFLIAICAVLAAVMLFGSTKVRSAVGVGLWTALIVPGLLTVATAALAMVRSEYRDAT